MQKKVNHILRELEAIDADERARGLPPAQRMRAVRPEVGRFLNLLILAARYRRILEIGTSRGYSGLWLGQAAQATGGQVDTLELLAERAAEAATNFQRAGLAHAITIHQGDARQLTAELPGPFDFVFIDAEKPDYITYLDHVVAKVVEGGLIVADNVTSHAEELAAYIGHAQAHPNLVSVGVPIGRGEEVSLKTSWPFDSKLLAQFTEIEAHARQVGGMQNVPHDAGRFLHILARATRARRILEVGMSNGYSTLWLASAAQHHDGHIATVERDSGKVNLARKNFKRAGLDHRIEIKMGEAIRVVSRLEGPFDFIFLDASKEDQLDMLQILESQLAPGGLVISDNALTHVSELAAYTAYVRSHPAFESLLVPIGNGFEMTLSGVRR